MGSLCSTSRSVQVRERRGSPRRGQKPDTRIKLTPTRNYTHKHSCNLNEDSRSLTLANPHAQENINTEVKQSDEKHYRVQLEKENNKIPTEPEDTQKPNEQPESPKTENAKIDTPNLPTDENQSETSKIDTETPKIDDNEFVADQPTAKQPLSPESTVVEINTPRKDLNPAQELQNENIENPPISSEEKVPEHTEEITEDMIPTSPRITISPKKKDTPAKNEEKLVSPAKYPIPEPNIETGKPAESGDNLSSATKVPISESPIENQPGATPAKIEENLVSPAKEHIDESTVETRTPAKTEESEASPTREIDSSPTIDTLTDSTIPIEENTNISTSLKAEETINNTELSPISHELTTITPEPLKENNEIVARNETEKVMENNAESGQPINNIDSIPTPDNNVMAINGNLESSKKSSEGIQLENSETAKSDTQETTTEEIQGTNGTIEQESPDSHCD